MGRRTLKAAALVAAALWLAPGLGCSTLRGCVGRTSVAEGVVLVAMGPPVLLEVDGAPALVSLEPGATLVGLGAIRELRAGDRVRFHWAREAGGVKRANRLEVEPVSRHEPEYMVHGGFLLPALAGQEPPILVDARTAARFAEGHLPGALSLPWDRAGAPLPAALVSSPATQVVVYGENSRDEHPGLVLRRLLAAGFERAAVLEGGVRDWVAADLHVELSPSQVSSSVAGGEPWLFVDARSPEEYAAATIPGAISVPMSEFRWQDFDGRIPPPPMIFFGTNASDGRALALAQRLKAFRSGTSVKRGILLAVLEGGLEGWEREGLQLERGAPRRTGVPFRQRFPDEISPEEFERLWTSRGDGRVEFLDVRRSGHTQEEWVLKISLDVLADRLGELPRGREFVVFCSVGERSRVAAELLRKNGFKARFLRANSGH